MARISMTLQVTRIADKGADFVKISIQFKEAFAYVEAYADIEHAIYLFPNCSVEELEEGNKTPHELAQLDKFSYVGRRLFTDEVRYIVCLARSCSAISCRRPCASVVAAEDAEQCHTYGG